jgi:hypothetical protein
MNTLDTISRHQLLRTVCVVFGFTALALHVCAESLQNQEHVLIAASESDKQRHLDFPTILDLGSAILIAWQDIK